VKPILLVPLVLAAAACNTGFDPQYRVTDLRILAVRAHTVGSSSADVSPADTLQLEALVANPAERAGLTVRWFTCAPTGTDAVPPCLDADFLRDLDALATTPGVIPIGTGELPPPLPLSELPATVLAAAIGAATARALESPTYRCRLYVEIPIVVVAQAEGRREVALKRVRLVPRPEDLEDHPELQGAYVLNLNPTIEDVVRGPADARLCLGGASVDEEPFPSGRTVVCGRSDAPGRYEVCGPAGERTTAHEILSWQWFVTAGDFPEFDGIGNAVGNGVDLERAPGPFTLWAVLRDGRGGVAWVRRDVGPAP
jgi:hypothetical protein